MSKRTVVARTMMIAGGLLIALAPLTVGGAAAAPTTPINPLDPAQGFGVVVEGDATLTTSENEGPLAVGGDLNFLGTYNVAAVDPGSFVVDDDALPTALVVGGRVDFADSAPGAILRIPTSAYVKIGDLDGAAVMDTDNNGAPGNTRVLPVADYDATPRVELTVRQPTDSVGPASPYDFAAAFASFRDTSTSLAECANTVVLRDAAGNPLPSPVPPGTSAVITLTPGMTNVLNISASDLANITQITFANQPSGDTPLLINVDTSDVGDDFTWVTPTLAGISGQQAPYILWNFPTAQTITLAPGGATLDGAIYAPNADVRDDSASNTEGSIIAHQYEHNGGEVHYFPFDAFLSCTGASPSPSGSASPSESPSPSPSVSPSASPSMSASPTPSLSPSVSASPSGSPTSGGGGSHRPTPPPIVPTSNHPILPVTGTNMVGLLGTGTLLLGGGLGVLLWARRTRDLTGDAGRTE